MIRDKIVSELLYAFSVAVRPTIAIVNTIKKCLIYFIANISYKSDLTPSTILAKECSEVVW